ncbi:MAG: glutathione S-transferase N-terminal domain-containing protein, partial [Steroidobacteraceae bacterium]
MKLYYTPGACSQAPHIVLKELGLSFEAEPVDLAKYTLPDGSHFRNINPKGYKPLLEHDDVSRMTEASVIMQY